MDLTNPPEKFLTLIILIVLLFLRLIFLFPDYIVWLTLFHRRQLHSLLLSNLRFFHTLLLFIIAFFLPHHNLYISVANNTHPCNSYNSITFHQLLSGSNSIFICLLQSNLPASACSQFRSGFFPVHKITNIKQHINPMPTMPINFFMCVTFHNHLLWIFL